MNVPFGAIVALASILVATPAISSNAKTPVLFEFVSESATQISVVGSFNNWDATSCPLHRSGSVWRTNINLDPGYYYYKFVVDGVWISDPANDWRVNDGGAGWNSIMKVGDPPIPVRKKRPTSFPKDAVPRPVLANNPEWVDLYYVAWELAWHHIAHGTAQNGFVEEYLDEGFNELIYQWDTCFMAVFGIYGSGLFPAMESLDNFYTKQREDGYIQRVYWESTGAPAGEPTVDEPMINPPLFAWIEFRYYRMTGDDTRLARVLPVLINYFDWIESNCRSPRGNGLYYTTALGSGMDNTPRVGVGKGGWLDISSQQALAAKAIAEIAEILGRTDVKTRFSHAHQELAALINRQSWESETRFYYDCLERGGLSPTKHIGAYWVLLSDVCTEERAACLAEHLQNPHEFWRPHLVPTLSADDPLYDPRGHYWRGGVWGPTNYMVTAGLARYGYEMLAHAIAVNHLSNITAVYSRFEPNEQDLAFEERYGDGCHTIWECYAPELCAPATRWDNTFYARQDFVGWSGLGPIAMLIEQILGITVVGSENRILWHILRSDRHGIERIRLRDQTVSLICVPDDTTLQITAACENPFELCLTWNGKDTTMQISSGEHTFSVER